MLPPADPHALQRRLLVGTMLALPWPVWPGTTPSKQPPRIIVVGAGIAGLYTAWKMQAYGAQVQVLEAQDRIGGRNWTLRGGDTVPDVDGTPQSCTFSPGQYFNAGPWRIMPWHTRMQGLVRQLHLELEPLSTDGSTPGWQPAGGMDAIPLAIARQMGESIRTACAVEAIRLVPARSRRRVEVEWRHRGSVYAMEADAVVVTLPLHRLQTLALPENLQVTAAQFESADALKVALQADADLPPTAASVQPADRSTRIQWPSPLAHPRQRIAALYANAQAAQGLLQAPRAQQVASAKDLLSHHLPAPAPAWAHPLVVQWSRIPFQAAAAARMAPSTQVQVMRQLRGTPPVFFAGDGLSSYNGWQEGALQSAQQAVQAIRRYLT